MLAKSYRVKKGDTVMIITGKDRGKTGKILRLISKKDAVVVEGLNLVKRHTKARGNEPGSIAEKESPLNVSNVMIFCSKCNKAVRTRMSVLEDGKKARVCKKCGESFDK